MNGKQEKMMNNYTITTNKTGNTSSYSIIENNSSNCLTTFNVYNDARKYVSQLKKGIGFNGFTPSFLLKSVSTK